MDDWVDNEEEEVAGETALNVTGRVSKIKEIKDLGKGFLSQGLQLDAENWYNAVGFDRNEIQNKMEGVSVGDTITIELLPPNEARGFTNNIKSITKTKSEMIQSKISIDDVKVMGKCLEDAQKLTDNPEQAVNIAIALFQSRMKK